MHQRDPPPLRLTRQWTQPTDFEHRTLSRVTYPSQQRGSPTPSPSPLPHTRTPLGPSPQEGSSRPSRQPLVASPTASPLPTQPSPLSDVRRTPQQPNASPVVSSRPLAASREQRRDASELPSEAAGRLFWRQQARRVEEANAALRAELDEVYSVLRGGELRDNAQGRLEEEHVLKSNRSRSSALYSRHAHSGFIDDGNEFEPRYDAVVQERNMARMELAQEREKNFLLRHRLRETEIALQRLEQQLRQRSSRAWEGHVGGSRPPMVGRPTAAPAEPKTPQPPPPTRRSLSRSSASLPSSRASSTSSTSSVASVTRQYRTSSPRPRSATRRHSTPRGRREREGEARHVTRTRSGATDRSARSRLSRGYERLHHRTQVRARQPSSPGSSSSLRAPIAVPFSSPLSPVEEGAIAAASPPSHVHAVAQSRVLEGRALLSSLLASHPATSGHRHTTAASHRSDSFSATEGTLTRQAFRSRLFSDVSEDGESDGEDTTGLSSSNAARFSEAHRGNVHAAYVARQLVSPTPPLLSRRASPAESQNIVSVLAQRPSSSASGFSVSLTTEEANPSRSVSLREDTGESGIWPSAHRAFSF